MFTSQGRYYDHQKDKWEEISFVIDRTLHFDYSHCRWCAIDGEFTGLYTGRDRSVLWTIASEDTEGKLRVEMLYTFDEQADVSRLRELILSDKEKLLWYGKLDIAFLYQLTGVKPAQPVYDVKLASLITRTYTQDHHMDIIYKLFVKKDVDIINKKEFHKREWMTPFEDWDPELHQYNINDVIYLKPLADTLKEVTRFSGREEEVNAANSALPELGLLYAKGYYKDIFVHGYRDNDMVK
ncbi:MAG: hypothetical protein ACOCXT_01505 [Candidatus Dojkabacteria bacterium]